MAYGWRGRGGGRWPGRGPFSYLPPWQRPGWLYGRGACWWLFRPYGAYRAYVPPAGVLPPDVVPALKPEDETTLLTEQKTFMEEQLKAIQETLKKMQERLDELKKSESSQV